MKLKRYIIPALVAIFVLAALPTTALANPGLTVSNTILLTNVTPGQTLPFTMTVSIGASDLVTNIGVEVEGITQSPDGTNGPLAPSEDIGPYSARSFISVDKSSFQLASGASQDVTATITVPQDVGTGGRYAIIRIVTQPPAGGSIGIVSAIDVPIVLTITDSQLVQTGKITKLTTGQITSGQPINILTNFQNTGNIHYKVQGQITVTDVKGQTLDTISMPLTATSIIPEATRQLEATFTTTNVLAAGTYTIDSKIMLQDGTVLDQTESTFKVSQPYSAPSTTVSVVSPSTTASPPSTTISVVSTLTPSVASPSVPASISSTSTQMGGVNWTIIVGAIAGFIIIVLVISLIIVIRRKSSH